MTRPARLVITIALAILVGALRSDAWWTLGPVWPDGSITMHLQLGSLNGGSLIDGGASWGVPAESALAIWNPYLSRVQFRVVPDSTAPIRENDGVNNVFWSNTVHGRSFGSAVAVATTWTIGNRRTEGDVVFNTAYAWNSYRGNLRQASNGGTLYDIRRVALHEYGHVLGLDHPDEHGQFVSAIMNSSVSNVEALTADDIAGVQYLYATAPPPPPPPPSAPGVPTGVSASVFGQLVTVVWTRPTTGAVPTSYRLDFRSGGVLVASVTVAAVNSTSLSAPAGTIGTFTVTVTAIAGASEGPPSAPASFTLGPVCGTPTTPTGLRGSFSAGTAVVSWSTAPGASSYIVRAGSAAGLSDLFNANVGSLTAVSASGLPAGFRAYVRVIAVNACGQPSTATGDILVGAPPPPPNVPNEPDVPVQPCSLEGSIRSLDGSTSTRIDFVNMSSQVLTLLWLDYSGLRVPYYSLLPGDILSQPTFVTHPWLISDSAGRCLGIVFPTVTPSRVVWSTSPS